MARYELIDAYLEDLRAKLRWKPDVDDVLAELADHLYSATELESGDDPIAAQTRILHRFGDTRRVATALARTHTGSLAVPTDGTRTIGGVALMAAALWPVFPVCSLLVGDDWGLAGQIVYGTGTLALIAAAALTVVVLVGVNQRLGGLGRIGQVGIGLVGLGAVAGIMSWFFLGWAALVAGGAVLCAGGMIRTGIAPRPSVLAFGAGWPLGLAAWAALRTVGVGGIDEWGNYPTAIAVGTNVGAVVFATGLIGLGRWLHREEPAALAGFHPLTSG